MTIQKWPEARKWYEIRPRGKFMVLGKIVHAKNYETARLIPTGSKEIDNLIIDISPGTMGKGDWCLISKEGNKQQPDIKINKKIIHPHDPDPKDRIAFAEACESICQQNEQHTKEGVNLKFNDFEKQAKEYQKVYINRRNKFKAEIMKLVATCLKECAIATNQEPMAYSFIYRAECKLKEAKALIKETLNPKSTNPNVAEKAIINAEQQIKITREKIKKGRSKEINTTKDKGLSIG